MRGVLHLGVVLVDIVPSQEGISLVLSTYVCLYLSCCEPYFTIREQEEHMSHSSDRPLSSLVKLRLVSTYRVI